MVNTRASSHAREESSGEEENYEELNLRQNVIRRRSYRKNQGDVGQIATEARRTRSNARTQQANDGPTSRAQSSRAQELAEAFGTMYQIRPDMRGSSKSSERLRSRTFESVSSRSQDANPQEEESKIGREQLDIGAIGKTEDDSRPGPSNVYRPWTSEEPFDIYEDQPDESESDFGALDRTIDQRRERSPSEHPNQLHIRPLRPSNWLSVGPGPSRRASDATQIYQRSLQKTKRADSIGPLFSRRKSLQTSPSTGSEDESVASTTRNTVSSGSHHPINPSSWKRFGMAFVEHVKYGSRYCYRKPRSFWISVVLALCTCNFILCSRSRLYCSNRGRLILLAIFSFKSPLEAIYIFTALQICYSGLLDTVHGLGNVLANIGIRIAHEQSETEKSKGQHSFRYRKKDLRDNLWLNTCFDLLDNIVEPLSMLVSSIAYGVLFEHSWSKERVGGFDFSISRFYLEFCLISLSLHMAKWGLEALEDVLDLHTFQANPRKRRHGVQRPLKTTFLVLLLFGATYLHRELIHFNIRQTWRYATAYSHGGNQGFGERITVHKIVIEPSSWTTDPTKVVQRVTEVVSHGGR